MERKGTELRGRGRGRKSGEGVVEEAKKRQGNRNEYGGGIKGSGYKVCRKEKERVERKGPFKEAGRGRSKS